MNCFIKILCIATLLLTFSGYQVLAEEFPARKDYPNVTPISTEELFKEYSSGNAVIIDVRSKIEYDAIHPKSAIHIALSSKKFLSDVSDVINTNFGKKIVFYCNGVTCLKSYEAAKRAMKAGYENCYVYDSGIPAWANAYPQETLLLNKVLINPANQLISKSDFMKRNLAFDAFIEKSKSDGGLVIDVRDHIQSSGKLPGLEKAKKIPLDTFIKYFVTQKLNQDTPLFIFDQVGKQVRWLEYYLVDNDYKNYFFLKSGATSVLRSQDYK